MSSGANRGFEEASRHRGQWNLLGAERRSVRIGARHPCAESRGRGVGGGAAGHQPGVHPQVGFRVRGQAHEDPPLRGEVPRSPRGRKLPPWRVHSGPDRRRPSVDDESGGRSEGREARAPCSTSCREGEERGEEEEKGERSREEQRERPESEEEEEKEQRHQVKKQRRKKDGHCRICSLLSLPAATSVDPGLRVLSGHRAWSCECTLFKGLVPRAVSEENQFKL